MFVRFKPTHVLKNGSMLWISPQPGKDFLQRVFVKNVFSDVEILVVHANGGGEVICRAQIVYINEEIKMKTEKSTFELWPPGTKVNLKNFRDHPAANVATSCVDYAGPVYLVEYSTQDGIKQQWFREIEFEVVDVEANFRTEVEDGQPGVEAGVLYTKENLS